uniref:Uncharacterized protein n=1 Tax=Compsopogon caeruleus TaxID=31354 RepID=A0A7S1TEM9_9RHOD
MQEIRPDILVFCFTSESLVSFEQVVQWDLAVSNGQWEIDRIWVDTRSSVPVGFSRSKVSEEEMKIALNYVRGRRRCLTCRVNSVFDRSIDTLAFEIAGVRRSKRHSARVSLRNWGATWKSLSGLTLLLPRIFRTSTSSTFSPGVPDEDKVAEASCDNSSEYLTDDDVNGVDNSEEMMCSQDQSDRNESAFDENAGSLALKAPHDPFVQEGTLDSTFLLSSFVWDLLGRITKPVIQMFKV